MINKIKMLFNNKDLSFRDQMIIAFMVLGKIIRGKYIALFLRSCQGTLYVGKKVKITHCQHISCGKNVKFEDYAEIHGLCKDGLIFKDNVTIGRNVMIRPSSYYGIDLGAGLEIGNNSSIGPDAYVGCSGKIVIGNNVMFGPKCSLFAENHNFSSKDESIKEQGVNQKGITIHDDCWIGSNCIILDGVTIGKGCVIGAGTLVTKDLEPNTVLLDKRNSIKKQR